MHEIFVEAGKFLFGQDKQSAVMFRQRSILSQLRESLVKDGFALAVNILKRLIIRGRPVSGS